MATYEEDVARLERRISSAEAEIADMNAQLANIPENDEQFPTAYEQMVMDFSGCPLLAARIALQEMGETNVEPAMNWYFEHMDDWMVYQKEPEDAGPTPEMQRKEIERSISDAEATLSDNRKALQLKQEEGPPAVQNWGPVAVQRYKVISMRISFRFLYLVTTYPHL